MNWTINYMVWDTLEWPLLSVDDLCEQKQSICSLKTVILSSNWLWFSIGKVQIPISIKNKDLIKTFFSSMKSSHLGSIHKSGHAFFTVFWPLNHLWLWFCDHFAQYLLNEIFNRYILLTTHPPQWHNVVCERPLNKK